jgi:hypothetical protein
MAASKTPKLQLRLDICRLGHDGTLDLPPNYELNTAGILKLHVHCYLQICASKDTRFHIEEEDTKV